MTFQAVARMSNQSVLVIGEITTQEAESASVDDQGFDGLGLYLMAVDTRHPKTPAKVIAKFASEHAASILANMFRVHGHLEGAS
jgi:hypothetical protein